MYAIFDISVLCMWLLYSEMCCANVFAVAQNTQKINAFGGTYDDEGNVRIFSFSLIHTMHCITLALSECLL